MQLSRRPSPALLRIIEDRLPALRDEVKAFKIGTDARFNDHLVSQFPNWPDIGPPQRMVLAGRYSIQTLIGQGGICKVYAGLDTRFNRIVVVKVLREEFTNPDICPIVFNTFVRESAALTCLNHPNLVSGRGLAQFSNGTLFFPMEFVEGMLLETLTMRDPLSWCRIRSLLLQLCDAVIELHKHGIIHRDIKPTNILVTAGDNSTEQLKLLDLGLMRYLAETLPSDSPDIARSRIGTEDYSAPEQNLGTEASPRADIYSVGVTVYYLLSGDIPRANFKPLSEVAYSRQTPKILDIILKTALARDPEKRFRSAQAMKDAIEDCPG